MNVKSASRRNGLLAFTLVELLVVIGIIALLISILLPSLAKARQSALTVACASNLKQIAMGFVMYANDNRSALPSLATKDSDIVGGDSYWWTQLAKQGSTPFGYPLKDSFNPTDAYRAEYWINFTQGAWRCPSSLPEGAMSIFAPNGGGGGYGCNSTWATGGVFPNGDYKYSGGVFEYLGSYWGVRKGSPKMTSLRRASEIMLVADCGQYGPSYNNAQKPPIDFPTSWSMGSRIYSTTTQTYSWSPWMSSGFMPRHNARGNAGFADGHVAAVSWADALNNVDNMWACDMNGDGKQDW